MHPLFVQANDLSRVVISAAIEVHQATGPGYLESVYEKCLAHELSLRGLSTVDQCAVSIRYKGLEFSESLRFDLLVEECLLIELKAVTEVLPIHKAQLLSYMKALNVPLGLLINFHELKLVSGIHRLILPGSNLPPPNRNCLS